MTVNEALTKVIKDLDTVTVSGARNMQALSGSIYLLQDVLDALNQPAKEAAQNGKSDSDQGDEK